MSNFVTKYVSYFTGLAEKAKINGKNYGKFRFLLTPGYYSGFGFFPIE